MTHAEEEEEKEKEDVVGESQLLYYLKTLADQTRLRILGLLAMQKRSVEELAVLLDLRPSTVSWHLARLKDIGLVDLKAEGNTHIYRMNGKGLGRINNLLANPHRSDLIGSVEMDAWERKVLQDFLGEGRLKEIPAYRKKREIILNWLVEQFEIGRTYTEKEVNEILLRYHPDYATLRREFIGGKYMARENGLYWRLERQTSPVEDTLDGVE